MADRRDPTEHVTSPSVVLLHSPLVTARSWGDLPGQLGRRGIRTVVVEIDDDDGPPYAARYIARAALEISGAAPEPPLLLVAEGAAGPLLPGVGAAQRAAHRPVAGYVLWDALLPQPGTPTRSELHAAQAPDLPDEPDTAGAPDPGRSRGPDFFTEPLPLVQDWPDAPCGYLLTDSRCAPVARLARMRGWPEADATGVGDPATVADALLDLVARL